MSDKLKNKKKATARDDDFNNGVDIAEAPPLKKRKLTTAPANDTVNTIQKPVIPNTITPIIESFAKLKELAQLIERHYDRYTDSEEKASMHKTLNTFTELDVSRLTGQLNDVESSQAAMLIRQIIKDHPLLERIHLQDNAFSPPDLQFIIKALIYVFHEPVKNYQLSQVNFGNSVTKDNLERSGAELMHLRKAYGDNIVFDALVYDHFIEKYRNAVNHYLLYLAKKIILPKAGLDTKAMASDTDILQAADKVIRQGLPKDTKNTVRFELAIKKYQAVLPLSEILHTPIKTSEIFEKFQTQYKSCKKILSKTINKDDDAHLERFYEQIGDVKPQTFIPVKKDSRSIFKTEPKKKKRAKKGKKKVSAKKIKTSQTA